MPKCGTPLRLCVNFFSLLFFPGEHDGSPQQIFAVTLW